MRDSQNLMIEFVKIVQRYPEIYDASLDTYRTRFSEMSWAKVANHVRTELNEECTVEELKVKWKGIRSSFNRYKSKLAMSPFSNENTCKKYYLCDHLRFLEPFLRSKGVFRQLQEDQDKSEETNSDPCNYVNVDNIDESAVYNEEEWNHIDIKPDVSTRPDKQQEADTVQSSRPASESYDRNKKRRYSFEGQSTTEDDNEDLTFFKSILPDIRNFSIREKRKLKMGILQLIDEIEKEREST
ncbi:uncharacterized protein LOC118268308 isoform X1 [Spodoptera frugiperda]|uniref:Uncharacterized protein LOC118268308 isoform X1 n=1 Tax=Spodoptera frugiperda TaxID=7108 RepID=A0A9R0D3N4_SPOFR|nr:uncharacterized protein LOC118268308 isoform X1 [Spodoptera frugiperda]